MLPDEVLAIIKKAAQDNPNDIDAATDAAERGVLRLAIFKDICPTLVRIALRHQVHDVRHHDNVVMLNGGLHDATPKVTGASQALGDAYDRALEFGYGYYIGCRTLGDIMGEELAGIAESETNIAAGHTFNADLCAALRKMVPDGKKVRDSVGETRLRALARRLKAK